MWLDLALFAVLLFFAVFGAARGALESGLRLASLGVSYAVAIVAAGTSGPALAESLGIAPLLGMPIAGTLAFVASHVLFSLVLASVRASRRRAGADRSRSGGDRALGALFGAARGGLLVLLIGWLGLLVGAVRESGVATALPDPGGSHVARWSGRVIGEGARTLLGGDAPASRVAGAMAARPAETLAAARALVEHPGVIELQRDGVFWAEVESGSAQRAVGRASFRELANDGPLRHQLASLGLIDEAAAATPETFREALVPVLEEVGTRVAALRSDPEFQALLRDPEILGMLEQGNTLGVLAHPRFQTLLRRVTAPS